MVKLRHFIRIFCFNAPQDRLFFWMTAVRPSLDRNFRFLSAIVFASLHLANSVASKWSTPRCGLLSIAICLAGKGAWFVAVSSLVSGVGSYAIFGPHLIIDLIVCPDCVSSLCLAVSEGLMSTVKRR